MRDFLRRSGWVILAMFFVFGSVVLIILSFVFQPDTDEQLAKQTSCTIQPAVGQEVMAEPEVFKPSGDVTALAKEDITEGNGQTVKSGDCITVKYHGTLANGTKFDGNFDQPVALKMRIGVGQVIPGWDQGVVGMKEGGVRRLVIPSNLGYGAADQETIPPNSDLVFVVKVLKIEKE